MLNKICLYKNVLFIYVYRMIYYWTNAYIYYIIIKTLSNNEIIHIVFIKVVLFIL